MRMTKEWWRPKGNVNLSQESVYGAHQWVLVPKCVHVHPPELHQKSKRSSSQGAILGVSSTSSTVSSGEMASTGRDTFQTVSSEAST